MGGVSTTVTAIIRDDSIADIYTSGLQSAALMLKTYGVSLADPNVSDKVECVEVLVGADAYSNFVTGHDHKYGVNLLQTPSGNMIIGPLIGHRGEHVEIQATFRAGARSEPLAVRDLCDGGGELLNTPKLWDLECLGIVEDEISIDDALATDRYIDTVEYDGTQYWVRLPFKNGSPVLPSNRWTAQHQLESMFTRLRKTPELLDHYSKVIQQLIDHDFVELVDEPSSGALGIHYLPHHCVRKDSVSTPLRVVFNASSKSRVGDSLNDCLLKGPNLTARLVDSLLKFRSGLYGYTADISKAFLRVGLKIEDRDYTRFLWYLDPKDECSPIVSYRFKAVLFGATCSPFLLHATLAYHFRNCDSKYREVLSSGFYVDNLIGVVDSESELSEFYPEASRVLKSANMPLQQWATNNVNVRNQIDDLEQEKCERRTNVLGLVWDTDTDTLNLKKPLWKEKFPATKRQLLSEISTVYDPLGLMSPLTIRGKFIMKETWKLDIGWDEIVPNDILASWTILRKELEQISTIEVPRSICTKGGTLHCFADASKSAYGAVCYIKAGPNVHILTSKARVVPMQTRTLPQLELTGVLVGAQLIQWVVDTMKCTFDAIYLWSDNEGCLQWIRNNRADTVYVRNRVAKILELKSQYKFSTFYVPTAENPADLLSRGLSFNKFKDSMLWWHGPQWLGDGNWPAQKDHVIDISGSSALTMEIIAELQPKVEMVTPIIDYERYSDWGRLLRVTRNMFKCLNKKFTQQFVAETYWLRYIQRKYFPIVRAICAGVEERPDTDPSQKMVTQLALYMDDVGIVRSRGRIHNTNDIRRYGGDPALTSKLSHVMRLFVLYIHEYIHHQGVDQTLATVRQQVWIPKGRSLVKMVVLGCIRCRRITAPTLIRPGPPDLPYARVNFIRPFCHIGVDYSGEILIRDSDHPGNTTKIYICLFTCMSSRAVHLEVAADNSAAVFVNLFRRFVASWGLPESITSDNASNFINTSKLLQTLATHPKVEDYFRKHNLRWHFIHARSPWEGGFYERLVGVVKTCLRKSLYRRSLSYDEIITLLMEVMSTVNNRPLTYQGNSPELLTPLTPNHLIKGGTVDLIPSLDDHLDDDPRYGNRDNLLEMYQTRSAAIARFTNVWYSEYLSALRARHHTIALEQDLPVKVGDVVLVVSHGKREYWPLGRVLELKPSADGMVRAVKVLYNGDTRELTLEKLVLLEVDSTSRSQVGEHHELRLGDLQSQEDKLEDERNPILVEDPTSIGSESCVDRGSRSLRVDRPRRRDAAVLADQRIKNSDW